MKLRLQHYKLFTWIICASVLFITSCKVDPQEPKTDVSDPNLVSEGISVLNAIKKSGNPPASTANAPTASNPLGSTIKVKPGSTAYVAAFFENAQNPVNGFYLQVNGANSYFEGSIPNGKSANSNVSGKTPKRFFKKNMKGKDGEETGLVSIPIEIPDDFEEGTFCVSYCVVDDEGNVSNVITVCIEVTEVGADDTGLFAGENPWNTKKAQYYEDGELYEEIIIGTPFIEIEEDCFKYTEIINYFKLTLKANGQYKEAFKAYYKEEDICTNEILYEDTEEYENNGYWTYNSETNKFFIFYTDDIDDEFDDSYFIEFEVLEITANKLTLLMEDEDFGEEIKIFFER